MLLQVYLLVYHIHALLSKYLGMKLLGQKFKFNGYCKALFHCGYINLHFHPTSRGKLWLFHILINTCYFLLLI